MKNWQKSRNYRRVKDEHGDVVGHIITVDGQDVEVTEEVFLAYSQADRRERYIMEEGPDGQILSLDQSIEDSVPLEETVPSTEDLYIEKHNEQTLLLALLSLNNADRELVFSLFFDDISVREYARQTGVSDMAVRKRRDKILKKLKKFFE